MRKPMKAHTPEDLVKGNLCALLDHTFLTGSGKISEKKEKIPEKCKRNIFFPKILVIKLQHIIDGISLKGGRTCKTCVLLLEW